MLYIITFLPTCLHLLKYIHTCMRARMCDINRCVCIWCTLAFTLCYIIYKYIELKWLIYMICLFIWISSTATRSSHDRWTSCAWKSSWPSAIGWAKALQAMHPPGFSWTRLEVFMFRDPEPELQIVNLKLSRRLPVSTVSNLFAAALSSLPGSAGSASGCQKLADLQSGRGRAGSSDEDAQAML